MMGLLLIGIVAILLIWIMSHLRIFIRNYNAARATGLPIVICPYDPDSVIFTFISEPLRPLLKPILPASIFAVFDATCWGWEFHDKGATHEKFGDAFIMVTTGHNRLVCADPAMSQSVLARRKDFHHPELSKKTMGVLGPNLVTSRDESWSRQRRIIAPTFNERISLDVWKEGVQQASALVDHVLSSSTLSQSMTLSTSPAADKSSDSLPGLRAIAINVLTRVAYGRHKPFSIASSYRDATKALTYVDGIALVVDLLLVAAFIPAGILRLPFMPQLSKKLGQAMVKLPDLTVDMLDQERKRISSADSKEFQNTIMTTLVRLSDQGREQDDDQGSSGKSVATGGNKQYLTEEEIAGNLFIFTAAGFDTTSNTMSYAICLLAAYPEWQAWIQAEIDIVLGAGDHEQISLEDYTAIFPKLTRCLAVMFETLRVYPAVSLLIRTVETNQTIFPSSSKSDSFILQAPCAVHVNIMALHTSRSTWGADTLDFKPTRWFPEGQDAMYVPPRGTFMPWSSGPRNCPGQKMSQVEFVSVVMTLFGKCSVEPVAEKGQTVEQARERLLGLLQDSQPVLTLQINKPREVKLKWTRR
ncbi:hypothetical protein HBH53_112200 [Parastagonospora nodorum]|nr:hypothetical protein HBH53_112200 [Parastagonospora nodorum]KAH3969033.1 hypothetical protein HBH52_177570 [Parastagonospora nodorum]KAH5370194.1 hypothetical protein HBI33_176560 [Parastagonospora nodorum]KAH5690369.1 hypothetical protein HBI44_173120 [Parastagonospora nodorum]KAH6094892.1 hypothetical protein HBI65_119460 [Parastagonospora nodorum]